jgi:hypothetical protein
LTALASAACIRHLLEIILQLGDGRVGIRDPVELSDVVVAGAEAPIAGAGGGREQHEDTGEADGDARADFKAECEHWSFLQGDS